MPFQPRTARDPYDGFKDDEQRRRALNTRVRCRTASTIIVAVAAGGTWPLLGKLPWLMTLFH